MNETLKEENYFDFPVGKALLILGGLFLICALLALTNNLEKVDDVIIAIIFLIIIFFGYFIPTLIAINRNHCNTGPIAIINVFFGWTFLGWVIALAWSFTDQERELICQ